MAQTNNYQEEMTESILEVRGLRKYFEQSGGFVDRLVGSTQKVKAVDGVDFDVHKGETLAIVGESGCGKSTLGKTILKLHQPTDGQIRFQGKDITELSDKEMKQHRQDMQIIFQDPLASLNPRQSVGEILMAPMKIHGIGDNKKERLEIAKDRLVRVGLKENHINRYPHQFSGGQQQRIAIARVLSLEPNLIIADEPVSALDVSVQAQILNLLDELKEELGLSLFFVAHDLSVVRHIADRVAVMYLGKIVEIGPAEEVFWNPQHPYTKSLLSAVPRLDPSDREDRIILQGTVPSPLNPPEGCRFHTRCPAVIPPADWSGSHDQFVRAFTFRKRLESGEIDLDAIETRLEAEGVNQSTENITDKIVGRYLKDANEIPSEDMSIIRQATSRFVEGDEKMAREQLGSLLSSPCEEKIPRDVMRGEDHRTNCHRVDEEEPSEPML